MLSRLKGAVLVGIEAALVDVEVDVAGGLPLFTVVGLPDASVQEARERVRAAVRHAGFEFPMRRITVNLAPSDLRKQGPSLDLAVAVGLLVATGAIEGRGLGGRLFYGELGLSGELRPTRGALAAAEAARRGGLAEVVCPAANAREAALAGLPAVPVESLAEAAALAGGGQGRAVRADAAELLADPARRGPDLASIRGHQRAKRALEVAAAGGHNVLLTGPPGSGKTLLARALPGILPRMTVDEALEVTRIASAAGRLPPGEALVSTRPFRAPHHGISQAGMVGGGSSWARPGEVTLAHRGVLFLDEFPEFPRSCLEALRQPLEDGVVTVVRSRHATTYPARFMLVAAMNPCPCGQYGSGTPCRCTPRQREVYLSRISGPLLDRIDLHVHVPRLEAEELLSGGDAEPSEAVRARVEEARRRAAARGLGVACNAELPQGVLLRAARATDEASRVLGRLAAHHRLSGRSVHRLLRVSRTIADLAGCERVDAEHVLEAAGYRVTEPRRAEAC